VEVEAGPAATILARERFYADLRLARRQAKLGVHTAGDAVARALRESL